MEEAIAKPIGDAAWQRTGLVEQDVAKARALVEGYLGLASASPPLRPDGKPMTEFKQPLDDAWVEAAKGPFMFLPRWLKNGARTGAKAEPEGASIFPRVHEEVPEGLTRSSTFQDESFLSCKSFEDSEFSSGPLSGTCRLWLSALIR